MQGFRLAVSPRTAPVTSAYLGALVLTTANLSGLQAQAAHHLLEAQSTNLLHLSRDPLRVLLTSAFWVDPTYLLPLWAIAFVLIVAPFERAVGARRTIAVLVAGHVGATVLTAIGIALAIRLDLVDSGISRAEDVGVSYAFAAVLAAYTYFLPRRWQLPYAIAAIVGVIGLLIDEPDFTDAGHAVALAIGFGAGVIVAGRVQVARPAWLRRRRLPVEQRPC